MNSNNLYGRQWSLKQDHNTINSNLKKVDAIKNNRCQRCNELAEGILLNGEKYCRECIGLGRLCESDKLVRNIDAGYFPKIEGGALTWKGKLTAKQLEVSNSLINSLKLGRDHLVHAVTGAGKTEILFNAIAYGLSQGWRIAIATPRIDVVDELYPRFCEAFSKIKIGKYHGRQFHEPEDEQFIICTTHQLLKFYHAFDLLIIDEVDSFPYRENPVLHFGAKQSVKKTGVRFYLTATPDKKLLKRATLKQIDYSLLKRRFHGGLLPVPKNQLYLRPFIIKNKLHPKLTKEIKAIINKGKPLLIFVPRIDELDTYLTIMRHSFPNLKVKSVYAGDKNRQEKVLAFRNQKIDLLLTTTILERGVTFKSVQVIVLAADDQIYNTPSLVQIAGRVGRNKNDKTGKVLFCYHHYTHSLREANKEIRKMNR